MSEAGENKENVLQAEQTFEEAMKQLEGIVEKLETGEVALEEAVQLFQKGMKLSAICHEKLQKVEKQVHVLLDEEGEQVKKEFHFEEDPS